MLSSIRLLVLVTPDVSSQLLVKLVRKLTARQPLVARQWFTHSCGTSTGIVFVTANVRRLFLKSKNCADRDTENIGLKTFS